MEMWEQKVRAVVEKAMGVDRNDVFLVVGSRSREEIARAFWRAGKRVATAYLTFMEDYGGRPLTEMPSAFKEYARLVKPTVTAYVADVQPGELPFRKAMVDLFVTELGARHAHMPGIDADVLSDMGDPEEVERTTEFVYSRVRDAREIHVSTAKGTELHVEVGKWKWVPEGAYLRSGWMNIPSGEVFTTPTNVEGVAVIDGSLGGPFQRFGRLREPVRVVIEGGEAVDMSGGPAASELWRYLSERPCGPRVGEFAIGTNTGMKRILGNLLHDEKFPGVHIAFGDPLRELTGADWECDVHVDGVMTGTTVVVDGVRIMEGGRFVEV